MFHIIVTILLAAVLAGAAYYDFCYKEMPTQYLLGAWGIMLVVCIVGNKGISPNMILGEATGILLILLSQVLKKSIGIGDGIVLCITGLVEGGMGNLVLFMNSLLVGAAICIILLIFYSYNRKSTIPFVPCILFAYIGSVIL